MVYLDSRKRNILNPASCERYIEGRLFTLPRDSHWGALSNKYCMRHLACDLVQFFRNRSIGKMQSYLQHFGASSDDSPLVS